MKNLDFEKDLNEKQKEILDFVKEIELGQWYSSDRIPNPRFPIMAIISIKDDGYDDDMDLEDPDSESFFIENNGENVPVVGTSYDAGSYISITPFCSASTDRPAIQFINWDRVLRWRYLMWNEADRKWLALINEKGDKVDSSFIEKDMELEDEDGEKE